MTTLESKRERYKYDAIEYYKLDMDWFAFIFIFFAIDVFSYSMVKFKILSDTQDGLFSEKKGVTEINLLEAVIAARVFQFLFIRNLRDMYQQVNKISNIVWLFLFAIYGGTMYLMLTIEKEHPMCRIVV